MFEQEGEVLKEQERREASTTSSTAPLPTQIDAIRWASFFSLCCTSLTYLLVLLLTSPLTSTSLC